MSNKERFFFDVTRVERKTQSLILISSEDVDEAESTARDFACNHDFSQNTEDSVNYEVNLVSAPAKAKTVSREQKYLDNGGRFCPACESEDIQAGSIEVDGQEAFQSVSCEACGAHWEDRYEMAGVSIPEGFDPSEKVRPGKVEE